ncbi:MAG: amino acid ABC transporter substrate-binding protein [Mucispirillum sp.]|nr:amino acid ABC transporter substrate-binding protein [Mucispirillum sp.]
MKKIIIFTICAIAALSALSCKKQENKETAEITQEKFIMGLDDSFPPMGFRDEQNNIVGFDVDLAKEAAKRLDMELVLQPIDWASKELELNTGKITCIWNGLSVDPAREAAMTLSKPYLANRMIIITQKDSPINNKNDLEGKTVGLQAGSTAVKALEKDPIADKVNQSTFENNILAITDLNIGRVDAVIMDEVVARYIIAKSANLYKVLDDALDAEYYAIAFKKGNTELAAKVEKALAEMTADGTAAEISKKWFGEDIILK